MDYKNGGLISFVLMLEALAKMQQFFLHTVFKAEEQTCVLPWSPALMPARLR